LAYVVIEAVNYAHLLEVGLKRLYYLELRLALVPPIFVKVLEGLLAGVDVPDHHVFHVQDHLLHLFGVNFSEFLGVTLEQVDFRLELLLHL
jgi:hypothetical protein